MDLLAPFKKRSRNTPKHDRRVVVSVKGSELLCDMSKDGSKLFYKIWTSSARLSEKTKAIVHDVNTGDTLFEINQLSAPFSACAVSSDAHMCLTGDESGTVTLFDTSSGQEMTKFFAPAESVVDVAMSNLRGKVASATGKRTVYVWDTVAESSAPCATFKHNANINRMRMYEDARVLYASCENKVVIGWDIRSGDKAFVLKGHRDSVRDCSVAADGNAAVSCSRDGTLRLWDIRYAEIEKKRNIIPSFFACDITPNGRRVVASGISGKIVYFDVSDSSRVTRLQGEQQLTSKCAISETGDRLMASSPHGSVLIFDVLPRDGQMCRVGDSEALLGSTFQSIDITSGAKTLEELYILSLNMGCSPMEASDTDPVLTTKMLVDALQNQNGESKVSTLVDVYYAHVVLRTLLDFGHIFSDEELGGPSRRTTFFYENIYARICLVVKCNLEKKVADWLLNDAMSNDIISGADQNGVLLGIQIVQDVDARFQSMRELLSNMFVAMMGKLKTLEWVLSRTIEALEDLKREKDRDKRVAMIAGWVKLGLSFLPIAGQVAMGASEVAEKLILSFSPNDMVGALMGLLSSGVDIKVAHLSSSVANQNGTDYCPGKQSSGASETETDNRLSSVIENAVKRQQTEACVQLVSIVLSDSFLEMLSEEDRSRFVSTITMHYGMGLNEVRQEAHAAMACIQGQLRSNTGGTDAYTNALEPANIDINMSGDVTSFNDLAHEALGDYRSHDERIEDANVPQATSKFVTRSVQIVGDVNHHEPPRDSKVDSEPAKTHPSTLGRVSDNDLKQKSTVRELNVNEVAELMSSFVCEQLCDDVSELRNTVISNVRETGMTGRGVMSSSIPAEKVARCVLYGRYGTIVNEDRDFRYLELVDYVQQLRCGEQ